MTTIRSVLGESILKAKACESLPRKTHGVNKNVPARPTTILDRYASGWDAGWPVLPSGFVDTPAVVRGSYRATPAHHWLSSLTLSRPRPHVLPHCNKLLNRPCCGWSVDKLTAAVGSVIKALNGTLAHCPELLLQFSEFVARERYVWFRAAGHVRFIFAIVS